MFTVCPKCDLTLLVTAADLRAGQGYVRCGRCWIVFNALAALSDERPGTSPTPAPVEDTPSDEDLEFDPNSADATQIFVEPEAITHRETADETPVAMRVTDFAQGAAAARESSSGETVATGRGGVAATTELSEDDSVAATSAKEPDIGVAEPIGSGTFRMLVLKEGDLGAGALAADGEEPAFAASVAPAAEARTLSDDDEDLERDLRALALQLEARDAASTPRDSAATSREATFALRDTTAISRGAPQAAAASDEGARNTTHIPPEKKSAPPPATTREAGLLRRADAGLPAWLSTDSAAEDASTRQVVLWSVAGVVLLLALAAQILHHHRHSLLSTQALGPAITAAYDLLGLELASRGDLAAYEVRRIGAAELDPAGSGKLTLRASVMNTDRRPQPTPLLRVVVHDRYGNPMAARELAPSSYAIGRTPPPRNLAGGQRLDARISFAIPNAQASGFELDACLPRSAGGVVCSRDVTP